VSEIVDDGRVRGARIFVVLAGIAICAVALAFFAAGGATLPERQRSASADDGGQVALDALGQDSAPLGFRPVHRLRAVPVDRMAKGRSGDAPSSVAAAEREERQPEILARDVIEALVAAGETEGIAVFPSPGTDPPKSGLVVPEDFELPEGYVRHYQATDDGKRLEAILMFSPDYEFLDEGGQPVALPDDGVVPPEMAPAGMPLRRLRVPKRDRGGDAGPLGRLP